MRTYEQTIDYLFNSTPVFEHVGASAYKEGLQTTEILDKHFNHPHHNYKTIHIAGTNGKGSCSHMIAAVLQTEGYKVGLYTSPHIIDFRERIKINGECISKEYVVKFVEEEKDFFEKLHPSFFEITTILAFKYFADKNVDIAVIEVGLGGRLDCTNIISPVLSVITNISFDHTGFLGNTLAKIANEKAGIIKKGTPVIIGEYVSETKEVFINAAKAKKSPLIFAEDIKEVKSRLPIKRSDLIQYQTLHFGLVSSDLLGTYQEKNINTILCACRLLIEERIIKKESSILNGISNTCKLTNFMGRWQTLKTEPLTICDTGHNIGGWKYLQNQLKLQKCKNMRIIFGMVNDKDIDSVLDLLPKDAMYYWTQATTKRAIPVEKLAIKAKNHGLIGSKHNTVADAYLKATSEASKEDFIFIGGSNYVISDLMTSFYNEFY